MAVAKVSRSVLPFARLVGLSRWHRCSSKMSSNERILVACSASAAGAPAAVAAPLDSRHLDMERRIPGLMRWVEFCNNGAAAAAAGEFLPLRVDGRAVGYLKPRCGCRGCAATHRPKPFKRGHASSSRSFVERLLGFPEVFVQGKDGRDVEFHSRLASQQDRTAALAGVLQQLRGEGAIDGWRDELYPAVQSFHDEPAFLIERAAAPYFGIKAYGECRWLVRCFSDNPFKPGEDDNVAASPARTFALLLPLKACTSTDTWCCQTAARSCGWRGAARPSRRGKLLRSWPRCPALRRGLQQSLVCAGRGSWTTSLLAASHMA